MEIQIIFLVIGLLLGALVAWFIAKYHFVASNELITAEQLKAQYIHKEVHESSLQQLDILKDELRDKDEQLRQLSAELSAKHQSLLHQQDRLLEQKEEVAALQQRFQTEFENIANKLLEEKSERFAKQNHRQLQEILQPLHQKIKDFESGIERRFLEEAKDKVSLRKEIEQLRYLNTQLSQDANNLAAALKGDAKTQGDWGEIRLEMILERAGLQKDIHFTTQSSFKDEEGKDKRPDFIIHLPGKKHLIIDVKVSLTAYEKYFNADSEEKKKKHLKGHIESLRKHIKDLSRKNYQLLYQIHSPDYLLLFVPIEPAFTLAIQKDSRLFTEALDKNIVLVTTSTLLATMRTVSYIWKQEKQKHSVLEIARQSGKLYDKFCAFVDDLKAVGNKIDSAKSAYDSAMNKLTLSTKKGDTLIGRAEKIKELGAKTSKTLPTDLLDKS
ncbi:MAG TPA: DNA recombination protein RmuC [Phaeodactylibacter sp.]|nr:DNA recombination protein RmuC [Phaeodactylibacter sp.]